MPSALFVLNKVILQWFGMRLQRVVNDFGIQTGWSMRYNVRPGSGWKTSYKNWIK